MKQYLRNRVSKAASYLEILLSVFIMIGILIVSISLTRDLILGTGEAINGAFTFDFRVFTGRIMQVIIGVEFVKMLSKHTPESTVDVLLFVVARKIIIEEPNFVDMAVGIVAIAVLFSIRKYFTNKTNPNGCILEGDTKISEMNAILRSDFNKEDCETVRELVTKAMELQRIQLVQGKEIIINDTLFKIYSIKDGIIDAVEAIPLTTRHIRWPWSKSRKK
jgi:hypothetical protein